MFRKEMFDYFFETSSDDQLENFMASLDYKVNNLYSKLNILLPGAGFDFPEFNKTALNEYLGKTTRDYLSGKGPLGRHLLQHIALQENLFAKPLPENFSYGWRSNYEKAFVYRFVPASSSSVKDVIDQICLELQYSALTGRGDSVAVNFDSDDKLGMTAKYVRTNPQNEHVVFQYHHPMERAVFEWDNLAVPETLNELHTAFWQEHKDITDESISNAEIKIDELLRKAVSLFVQNPATVVATLITDKYDLTTRINIKCSDGKGDPGCVVYSEYTMARGGASSYIPTNTMSKVLRFTYLQEVEQILNEFMACLSCGSETLIEMFKQKQYRLTITTYYGVVFERSQDITTTRLGGGAPKW